jgi:endonuclease YncB( thermonuclease family)
MRILIISATLSLTLFTCCFAGIDDKNFGSVVVSEATSIYDGDTFRCTVAGWPGIIGERISIRINGIDTPEMKDRRPEIKALARKAKQFVVNRLRAGQVIELRDMQRGKYFRIVADVYVDGVNLGDELITAGLAKPYDGGVKSEW